MDFSNLMSSFASPELFNNLRGQLQSAWETAEGHLEENLGAMVFLAAAGFLLCFLGQFFFVPFLCTAPLLLSVGLNGLSAMSVLGGAAAGVVLVFLYKRIRSLVTAGIGIMFSLPISYGSFALFSAGLERMGVSSLMYRSFPAPWVPVEFGSALDASDALLVAAVAGGLILFWMTWSSLQMIETGLHLPVWFTTVSPSLFVSIAAGLLGSALAFQALVERGVFYYGKDPVARAAAVTGFVQPTFIPVSLHDLVDVLCIGCALFYTLRIHSYLESVFTVYVTSIVGAAAIARGGGLYYAHTAPVRPDPTELEQMLIMAHIAFAILGILAQSYLFQSSSSSAQKEKAD